MPKPSQVRFLLFAAAVFIFGVKSLQACTCARIGPACQTTWTSDAVFLGKVVGISGWFERILSGSIQQKRVTFQVTENFNGVSGRTVEIVTGIGGGDCGIPFQEGHEYLVYASHARNTASLYAGICSRTSPVERAASDLAYLRSLAKNGPPSRVYGFVTEFGSGFIESSYAEAAPHPIANVLVHLQSETATRRTITDSKGNYSFEGLPPGSFTISADMPKNLGGGEKRLITLREHACTEQIFVAVERAQLTGKVSDENQLPVATIMVAMMPTPRTNGSYTVWAYTGSQGIFTIERVPPGDYVLGVNINGPPGEHNAGRAPFLPTYYPGVPNRADARIIHVQSAQQLVGFDLRLPLRLRQRTITGRVSWPDGKPAIGAFVELKDSEFPAWNVDLGTVGRDGTFTVIGVEKRSYSLSSLIGIREGESPMHSETVHLKPDNDGPYHLVLSQPGRQ